MRADVDRAIRTGMEDSSRRDKGIKAALVVTLRRARKSLHKSEV